jgi:hypothetical protein
METLEMELREAEERMYAAQEAFRKAEADAEWLLISTKRDYMAAQREVGPLRDKYLRMRTGNYVE